MHWNWKKKPSFQANKNLWNGTSSLSLCDSFVFKLFFTFYSNQTQLDFKDTGQSLRGFTKHMPWSRSDTITTTTTKKIATNMAQVLANPENLQLKPRAESCRLPAVTTTNSSVAVLFETGNRRTCCPPAVRRGTGCCQEWLFKNLIRGLSL